MHGRRRRQRDLRRQRRDGAQEFIFVKCQRLHALDLGFGIRSGEFDFMALVVTELERGRFDLEARRALDETPPVGAAAEFAVGDDLQADFLLKSDHVADALILQPCEFAVVDFLGGVAAEGLAQHLRAQQAANVITSMGSRRRSAPSSSSRSKAQSVTVSSWRR